MAFGNVNPDGSITYTAKSGADGYSPSAKVTQLSDGAKIDITDKDGTTSATVKNVAGELIPSVSKY